MEILNKDAYHMRKEEIVHRIKSGAIFIYPTDTIYGIGAHALDHIAIKKVREVKARYERPFSIIAPSKDWIEENCEVSAEARSWIDKLPGPYTLVLRLKNKQAVHPLVNAGMDTLGIRIPKHWCAEIAKDLKSPIITTSANITGKIFMTSLDDLDISIKARTDFMFDEGPLQGKPSDIIDLTKDKAEITSR